MPRHSPIDYQYVHKCPLKPGVSMENRSICDSTATKATLRWCLKSDYWVCDRPPSLVYHIIHYVPNTLPLRPQRHRIAAPRTLAAAAQTLRTPHQIPPPKIVNAILYILRTGAAWRMLPHNCRPTASCFTATAPGNRSTMPCASKSSGARGAIPSPAPPSWTAR